MSVLMKDFITAEEMRGLFKSMTGWDKPGDGGVYLDTVVGFKRRTLGDGMSAWDPVFKEVPASPGQEIHHGGEE